MVLLTGIYNPIGRQLLKALQNAGHAVRVLEDRAIALDVPELDSAGIQKYCGRTTSFTDCIAAMQGCQVVIHAGIRPDSWPLRSRHIRKANLLGTIYLLRAARLLGIRQFVLVDTIAKQEGPSAGDSLAAPEQLDSAEAARAYVEQQIREAGFPGLILQARSAAAGFWASIFKRKNPAQEVAQEVLARLDGGKSLIIAHGKYRDQRRPGLIL